MRVWYKLLDIIMLPGYLFFIGTGLFICFQIYQIVQTRQILKDLREARRAKEFNADGTLRRIEDDPFRQKTQALEELKATLNEAPTITLEQARELREKSDEILHDFQMRLQEFHDQLDKYK